GSNSLSTGSLSGVGGAPLPAASFGDTTSTPAPTAAAPAATAPQVALGNKPAQSLPLQPAANKGPSDRDRILLGLLMLGLIGWTLVRDQLPSAQRRPSLYDLPAKPSSS